MSSPRAALALATWFGCGYFPAGPGTAGSVAAAGIGYLLWHGAGVSPVWLGVAAAALFWPAVWASSAACEHWRQGDPSRVVVDEVVGQWLALASIDPAVGWQWAAGLGLFRLLDIAKPGPLRRPEKLPAGWGIVADDAVAGLCVMMILAVYRWLAG